VLTLGQRVGNVVRLSEVVQILVRHGFADLVRRAGLHEGIPAKLLRGMRLIDAPTGEPETVGTRLRAALTELGPTFVKFGQILSTRPDLLGNELCAELSKLQDNVDALPFEEMAPVVNAEAGAEVEELYAEFDKAPVAAASLSQVYRATLKTGEKVAVKIQRPGAEGTVESDLSLMRRIAEWVAEHVDEMDWIDPVGIVDEFARSIRRELDFSIEARLIDRFRQNFDGVASILVPRTYPELSGKRMLTMDWVDGVRVDALDQYAARNCDPKTVAATGCEILCTQVFEHRLFHADPHPGNIFITHDNQIAFLDYGMIGHLERTDAAVLTDVLQALFREDAAAFVETALTLTTSGEPEDRKALEHEIADFIAFEAQAILRGGEIGQGIELMVDILRRNHLELAPRFSLLLKGLATIEAVGHKLDPEIDMTAIIQPYVERLVAARYSPLRVMMDAHESMVALLKLGRDLPGDLQRLLRMLRNGQLRMQVNHEGLEHLSAVTDRASNRIAFGVITGALIIGSSVLMTTGAAARNVGLAGYVIAGVLGLALAISILRSRNY